MFSRKAVTVTAKVPHAEIRKCHSDNFILKNLNSCFVFFFLSLVGIERHSTIAYMLLHLTGRILRKIRYKIDKRKLRC